MSERIGPDIKFFLCHCLCFYVLTQSAGVALVYIFLVDLLFMSSMMYTGVTCISTIVLSTFLR